MQNPKIRVCECDKACKIGEYLDIKNYLRNKNVLPTITSINEDYYILLC